MIVAFRNTEAADNQRSLRTTASRCAPFSPSFALMTVINILKQALVVDSVAQNCVPLPGWLWVGWRESEKKTGVVQKQEKSATGQSHRLVRMLQEDR